MLSRYPESEILTCRKNKKWTHCQRALSKVKNTHNVNDSWSQELTKASLCSDKDLGLAPPCFCEGECCQKPVGREANSPLCVPVDTAFKNSLESVSGIYLGVITKSPNSLIPKSHICSIQAYQSWLSHHLPGSTNEVSGSWLWSKRTCLLPLN